MPRIETTLSVNYQAKEWDLAQALREIVANALDGQERGKASGVGRMSFVYSKRRKVLTVANDGIRVPTSALLMGTSDSRANKNCIGEFGEGLPMALLVLARKGMELVIYNRDEKWVPSIERSETFGEKVLVVKTRQMLKDRGGFCVELHGLEADEVVELKRMFLILDPDFEGSKFVEASTYGSTKVLLDDRFTGRIYNKGVYVLTRSDLMFGYDLDTELNRDRSLITTYNLQSEIDSLLGDALKCNASAILDVLVDAMFVADERLELSDSYSNLVYADALKNAVYSRYASIYGAETIAVTHAEDQLKAEALGYRAVVVSPVMERIIRDKGLGLTDLLAKHETSIEVEWCGYGEYEKLTDVESQCVAWCDRVLDVSVLWGGQIRVVDFKGDAKANLVCSGKMDIARGLLAGNKDVLLREVLFALHKNSTAVIEHLTALVAKRVE